MHDMKERLSVLWIFALLNYLYADVIALWAILGSAPADTPHLGPLALALSAVLMERPRAVAQRSVPELMCGRRPRRRGRLEEGEFLRRVMRSRRRIPS